MEEYKRLKELFRMLKCTWDIFHLGLLKGCFSIESDNYLFNRDGSLIDINRLQQYIIDEQQSHAKRQLTWPYLLNIYSPSMTNSDKKLYRNRAKIRYEK